MKIGVSGASGHLGRAVVSELLKRPGGHEVVAITRTPENVSGPAQGPATDPATPTTVAPRALAHRIAESFASLVAERLREGRNMNNKEKI